MEELGQLSVPAYLRETGEEISEEHYAWRLRRLVQLRKDQEHKLNIQGLKLMSKSIFSAYICLREMGRQDWADEILAQANQISPPRQEAAKDEPALLLSRQDF